MAGKDLPKKTPTAKSGNLRRGNPGNRGGNGATPKAFKDFIRDEIRNGFKSRHALVEASQDPDSKAFAIAWKLAADYDTEKPAQRVQIDVSRLAAMSDDELAAIVKGKT